MTRYPKGAAWAMTALGEIVEIVETPVPGVEPWFVVDVHCSHPGDCMWLNVDDLMPLTDLAREILRAR